MEYHHQELPSVCGGIRKNGLELSFETEVLELPQEDDKFFILQLRFGLVCQHKMSLEGYHAKTYKTGTTRKDILLHYHFTNFKRKH